MDLETMELFQDARTILGRPLYGTSWGRCAQHNLDEGGKWDSAHLFTETTLARAGDVTLNKDHSPMTPKQCATLLGALWDAGFRRFGLEKQMRFIHTDNGKMKSTPSIWFY
jgi:hypothetical protein